MFLHFMVYLAMIDSLISVTMVTKNVKTDI